MPRRARLFLPEVPLHIIQRGNNRQPCFLCEADYAAYLHWLAQYAEEAACRVHAYVLMGNHVHLLVSCAAAQGPAGMMKMLGQRYAQYFNWRHGRSGTPWDGRFKSCLVQDEVYFLTCQRYVELNPVRAGMAGYPAQYRWSSYRCNADGRANPLVQPHSVYQRLGGTPAARQLAYRRLCEELIDVHMLAKIRSAFGGQVLGDEAFVADVARRLRLA
jgi:putative transposase